MFEISNCKEKHSIIPLPKPACVIPSPWQSLFLWKMDFYPLFYIFYPALSFHLYQRCGYFPLLFMPFSFQTFRMGRPSLKALMRFHGTYAYISCISLWFSGSFAFWRCHNGAAYLIPGFLSFSLFYECLLWKEGVLCFCLHMTIVGFLYSKGFLCILLSSIE